MDSKLRNRAIDKMVLGIVLVTLICTVAPAMADTPPTPFRISGWVNDSNGDPVNNPDVAITNTNTGEEFVVVTVSGSNYYRAVTGSYNVSANDALSLDVDGVTAATPSVTQDEINAGGFEQNLTVEGALSICGDVTCDGVVDTGDVILLSNYVGYYPGNLAYALNSTQKWAGDVTGNCVIDTGDVILLSNFVGYSGYTLRCNSSCTW